MRYVYVDDVYDERYRISPPLKVNLVSGDIPEEELEIREILRCWMETGLSPFQTAADIKMDFWTHADNFSRLSCTLNTLLKHKAYYFAAKRVATIWRRGSIEKAYLEYLLTKHIGLESHE
ncbi:hypothetical protein HOP38_10245 [Vibrio mediterranei]|uniref:hypothetical protein n=1 Tax=Vibrio TaxID=662 RepID=UPI0017F9CB02|nr:MULTISPECIES: hypothetical protein [Vibrio]MDA0109276.1 hypothetical protein [Vibrio sp. La 4.2.2]NUW72903.1 hypothetical protein [Vibrio mediterranei]USD99432.1 hypothetical protein JKJ11_10640 [Vibrio sp. SCSIO 43133]